ncbi:pentapeptide repeat-containing protein [Streptomyces sp. Je 1-4]|uniref:pentapeptide repeat-containing protein n=1 Tax=Streptomyces TaxID=1883 RepID=UPI0021D930C5|nr:MULTISPECIES: pentapeptide repeat-containing protein [unclassified Streptomyces]UYB41183.1 pentapeptide repeat-containing protein [Streptomyces sp. Je 1-4]UZQ37361.1 pentapeptide repeat-containing protein [Streptomyces sp. Je 1-4] [Streptomyces sp. Je 1-4 4N24]UZQ44778.1 pentapeptide repeat-containing protein [Streptomyces sp. Je 1-4] [Streptomyces sp. Je 1-4 4N24_ara]
MPRSGTGQRSLRLWHVWIVLPAAFATAIAVAAGAFFAGWDLLGAQGLKPERQLSATTLFDLVKLSFGVVAGAGALVALVVAYRRQRVDEDGALRDATRLHTERFTTAVSQLGEESAAVRLGGVHALAGLADDAPTPALRQTCIDVLCAYLRLPYTAKADLPADDGDALHGYLALREVRHTVIRLIRDHLRLRCDHSHSWQGHDLDFSNVIFDGGDFSRAEFSGGTAIFNGAEFSGDTVTFNGARFTGGTVTFDDAKFSGGTVFFKGGEFSGGTVAFNRARFAGGTVFFDDAGFSGGTVFFGGAEFSGGMVGFNGARFSGGTVFFDGGEFSGGTVAFTSAEFSGGTVAFTSARFSGGTVAFISARFTGGTVAFISAEFSGSGGTVTFNGSELSGGTVTFDGSEFSGGAVTFNRVRFAGGTVTFDGSEFSGSTVAFNRAEFAGGAVSFSAARGDAPCGLLPPPGQAMPTGLSLPEVWHLIRP